MAIPMHYKSNLYFMRKNLLLSSVLACMLMAAPVSADVVGLHTAAPVGEKLSIALNENVQATLAWGDGSTETVVFSGSEVEITVKHSDLTVTTNSSITSLYCPDCSLTAIDLTDVPHLASLICPDNKLTDLNLNKVEKLNELNCEGNQLKSLPLSKCKNLVTLNCSKNELTSLSLPYQTNLKTLICGYNKLRGISISNLRNLETLWCQNNEIGNISFSSAARPAQICAFDNQLASLNTNNLEGAKELWLDNNQLKSLDLSKTPIYVLSASRNDLREILMDKKLAEDLSCFYVDDNELLINSLPSVYNKYKGDSTMHYNISNQRPYVLTDRINVNEKLVTIDLLRKNGVGYTVRPKVEWVAEDGTVLVKNDDYKESNYAYTFLKPFKSVKAQITSEYYPNETFYIANFQVVDPTGIEDVNAENNLKIVAKSGQLQVIAPAETLVQIYNITGAKMVDEIVTAGVHGWNLPVGVYVVNGQKVVLNH